MSLFNDKILRKIDDNLFIVSGEWSGRDSIGFGPGDHPYLILPVDALLSAKTSDEEKVDIDRGEQSGLDEGLWALFSEAETALQMSPISGYYFVKGCIAGGYDIERDGSNVACWVVDQMQAEARALPVAAAAPKAKP